MKEMSAEHHQHHSSGTMNHTSDGMRRVWVPGPVIVGAGPSGLAAAACLKLRGVPSLILERADRIAALWQLKTYDRLRLHLPKQFCELPYMPFPADFPTYPTKPQFITYLQSYAERFQLHPTFNSMVKCAEYDGSLGLWRVRAVGDEEIEYLCRWLVVGTGENAEPVVPTISGIHDFAGPIIHTSMYKSGSAFCGKRVLVVGCGNSGMEVALDLYEHKASPSITVRNRVHILPREVLGISVFALSMWLMKWSSLWLVDDLLLLVARIVLGDTSKLGLPRPKLGPLRLKETCGKTPVLDVGTLAKIRAGEVKVRPAIKRLTPRGAEFMDGIVEEFDAVILATGYRSNVPAWLKSCFFSEKDGLPKEPFPDGWNAGSGLYTVGFTKRGLVGASQDAARISEDIGRSWKVESKKLSICSHLQSPLRLK